jgi:hypothetical protein
MSIQELFAEVFEYLPPEERPAERPRIEAHYRELSRRPRAAAGLPSLFPGPLPPGGRAPVAVESRGRTYPVTLWTQILG